MNNLLSHILFYWVTAFILYSFLVYFIQENKSFLWCIKKGFIYSIAVMLIIVALTLIFIL